MELRKENIAFDQYQRYQTIANLIEFYRKADSGKTFRVLELGANEHKDLKLFLDRDQILFTDITLTEAMRQDPEFRMADGTALAFDDQSYDFVIAADVFEHVPPEKRESFLSEAYRVCKAGVILCFPYASRDVSAAEDRVNAYYKTLAGEDFIWLKEHLENGLPDISQVNEYLTQSGIPHFSFYHGDLAIWEKMWYCLFNAIYTPETLAFRKKIDHYYNENVYQSDVSHRCYRVFCVLSRGDVQDWKRYASSLWNTEAVSSVNFLDTLIQAQGNIHPVYDQGRLQKAVFDKEVHIQNLGMMMDSKEQHIQNLNAIVEEKEQHIQALSSAAAASEQHILELDSRLEKADSQLLALGEKLASTEKEAATVKDELANYQMHYSIALSLYEEQKKQLAAYENRIQALTTSTSWRLTKPLRVIMELIKKLLRSNQYVYLSFKSIKALFRGGFSAALAVWEPEDPDAYKQDFLDVSTTRYTQEELDAQRTVQFPKDIKFSILVPVYNTPEQYLHEMIQSVLGQTYTNWELCLADGSDKDHKNVRRILKKYARQDKRIRYRKLRKNLGISGNTNACIDMATGDFISLFDHDDLLHPAALFATMKAICEQNADFVYTDENTFHHTPADAFCPHFKPDYAPDTLRANNYICHFTSFKKSLLDTVGNFRPQCDGSQDFDMMLRLTEQAETIVHIPQVLYYWRAHPNSVADSVGAKPYVIEAAKRAIRDHLQRVGLKGEVLDSEVPSMYRLRYEIEGEPLVSILIPNYEHKDELKVCLDSIYEKSTYKNFEVIIVENNSKSDEIFEYYQQIQKKWDNLKVVVWDSYFNYSAINNYGAQFASGEHLLLLNNDIEVISPDWIQEMLMYSQRSDVGAVGAKLYYPDDTIQHAGLGLGILTLAGHLHRHFDRKHPGYMGRLVYAQNLTGVTAACVMIRRDVWDEISGLDESFEVAFNDVDMCMRIRKAGYLIVWTPFAELYHYESKSRGIEDTPEKQKRFLGEVSRFQTRWARELAAGDPYFNPNFSLEKEDFTIK